MVHERMNFIICFLHLNEKGSINTDQDRNSELRTLDHFDLHASTVFEPPFFVRPSDSLRRSNSPLSAENVRFLKLAPSPASALCSSKNVAKYSSSSAVQIAHSLDTLLVPSGPALESVALCLLRVM